MFNGHLQVLFYALPPDSQFLFSKPGNGPLLALLLGLQGLRVASYQKVELNKNFLEFDFIGGLFYQKYHNFDF